MCILSVDHRIFTRIDVDVSLKVPLRRKSHLFKLTFLGSKLVFRLKTSRKNMIQTNLTKKVP